MGSVKKSGLMKVVLAKEIKGGEINEREGIEGK